MGRTTHLRLQGELKGVDAIREVGGERVVQLAQGLLQRLERLLVLLQRLQLLLEDELPVRCLQSNTSGDLNLSAWVFPFTHRCFSEQLTQTERLLRIILVKNIINQFPRETPSE